MSNYSSLNSVAIAVIESVNGVAVASVASINDANTLTGDDSVKAKNQPDWAISLARTSAGAGKYGYAQDTDRTSWTSADYKTSDRNGGQLIKVGKNASGQGIFMIAQSLDAGGVASAQNQQLAISGDDITDGTTWTNLSIMDSTLERNCITALQWSRSSDNSVAGVWMAGTASGKLFRSTDGGSTWSQLNESSNVPATWRYYGDGGSSPTLTTSNLQFCCVRDITSEGNGTWVIIQKDRMFKSTDDGLNWTEITHGINMGDTYIGDPNKLEQRFFGIIYTNNSYVVTYRTNGNDNIKVQSADKSDLTDWGAITSFNGSPLGPIKDPYWDDDHIQFVRVTMAANGSGKVMFASFERTRVGILDVSGKTISNASAFLISSVSRLRDITTDGNGVWLVSAEDGDIWESTSNGASFTKIVDTFPDSTTNLNSIASNVYSPITFLETQWGVVAADGGVGYGSGSAPTSWHGYRSPDSSTDHVDLGYGRDGSGNPLWVKTTTSNTKEIAYSSDITDPDGWTTLSGIDGRRYNVKWANNKWIAVGSTSEDDILTSTNGSTWSSVDVSALGLTTTNITSLATDGGNNWIFGQDAKVYASSNHGVNWYLLKDFADSSVIHEAAYSNNKWYVLRTDVAGTERVGVATSATSGSWTDSNDTQIGGNARAMFASVSTGSASESTVIVVNSNDVARSVDSGATFTYLEDALPHGSARSVVSDGDGNWIVGHDNGRISYSNNDGETWSNGTASGIQFDSGTEDIAGVAVNKLLPL